MYIKVKIYTGVKKEKFEKTGPDECIVWVREKAERNEANVRMLQLLKEMYRATRITLVSGHHHSSKIVDIV